MSGRLNKPMGIGFFLFCLLFIFYSFGVSSAPLGGDTADFLIAVITRGNPHPSGYPTYTLFGILFSLLPISGTLASKVGLASAFFAACGALVFYILSYKLTKSILVSLISSCSLAFLYPFWLYAQTVEVLSLNYFFVLLLLFVSVLYYKSKSKRLLLLLSFLLGLSLTNNLIILAAFPSVFILVLSKKTLSYLSIHFVITSLSLFFVGLLPYLYLFYGSSHDALHIWPKVDNLSNFAHYILRKDYGWLAENELPLQDRLLALQSFIIYWGYNLPKAILIVSLIGAFDLLRRDKIIFLSLFTGFFLSGVVFLTYSANPLADPFSLATLERFYMMPMLFFVCCFPIGIVFLKNRVVGLSTRIGVKKTYLPSMVLLVIGLFTFSQFLQTAPRMNFKNLTIGLDYSYDMLSILPKNSIIVLKGDSLLFNTLYVQNEYSFRKDILPATILSIDHFVTTDKIYAARLEQITAEKKYKVKNDLHLKTVFSLNNVRPVFAEQKVGKDIVDPEDWIPYGLFYRLRMPNEHLKKEAFIKQQNDLVSKLHIDNVHKTAQAENLPLHGLTVQKDYSDGLIRIGSYIISEYKDVDASTPFFEKAYAINPLRPIPLRALIGVYILEGKCKKAQEYTNRLSQMKGEDVSFFTDLMKNKTICK